MKKDVPLIIDMHTIIISICDANEAVIIPNPDRIPPVMPRYLVSTRSVQAPTTGPIGERT